MIKPKSAPYFALSYVWGNDAGALKTSLKTDKANLEAHLGPGAFDMGDKARSLPRTPSDAMRLVKNLGGRYCWIDRLCIVQDDMEQKEKLIQSMGLIYAQAYCTLIACNADTPAHGLRGISGGAPRVASQQVLRFPTGDCVVLGKSRQDERQSHWNRRGWTFQERILSRRALVFTRNSVSWSCQRNMWLEDLTGDAEGHERSVIDAAAYSKFEICQWPNLVQWAQLLSIYNHRDLSFESDRVSAFAGIETALNLSFPDGFFCGLPEAFFDLALLWQPKSSMSRRRATTRQTSNHALPSWSLVGWKGIIDIKSLYPGLDYIRSNPEWLLRRRTSCVIKPLVEWCEIDASGRLQSKISNKYHAWRNAKCSDGGWMRFVDEDSKETWYEHPLTGEATFWWPVPLKSAATLRPLSRQPFLKFRSSMGNLKIGETIPGLDLQTCVSASLRDSNDKWVGCLRLPCPDRGFLPIGKMCELVAISLGQADNRQDESWILEEWSTDQRPVDGPYYNFVNVLWVERDGEWIERNACGRVEMATWQRLNLEEREFKLR